MEEYDLEEIPIEYTTNLLNTIGKYPEYNNVLLDLLTVFTKRWNIHWTKKNT